MTILPALLAALGLAAGASAQEPEPSALHPGLARLYGTPYQSFSLTPLEFDSLWTVWPEPLRSKAKAADPETRRTLALERYGLPLDPRRAQPVPSAFAEAPDGRWALNCLACHQGTVAGQFIPGLGNSRFAFRTLVDDYLWLRQDEGRSDYDLTSQFRFVSLGESNGTTNAQVFSALLAGMRQPDLERIEVQRFTHVVSHDMDAPPLWHMAKKSRLYADGYIDKHPRVVMQFALALGNTADELRAWEADFEEIAAWMESLTPPPYPYAIDQELASQGRRLFEETCADCHGSYGAAPHYPEVRVPIEELGTDPVRLRGLSREFRIWMRDSWLGRNGEADIVLEPQGYLAPPLDGIWASAPYLHNGSVPSLHHLLFPAERPARWRALHGEYDAEKVGLPIETAAPPERPQRADEARQWFDTRLPSKSAAGHLYPEALHPEERRAVLEYLKTL